MSDVNKGSRPISTTATEKQFLEDLELAKRLSLDDFEREKRRWSKPKPFFGFSKRTPQPLDTNSQGRTSVDDSQAREFSITPRPRPFSRAVSTSSSGAGFHLSSSVSTGKIIQSPVSINPPPETSLLRRNRSLPYRYRRSSINTTNSNNNSNTDKSTQEGEIASSSSTSTDTSNVSFTNWRSDSSASTSSIVVSTTTTTTAETTREGGTTKMDSSQNNDDLILFASPKVTPKLGFKNSMFCDITSNIPSNNATFPTSPSSATSSSSSTFTNGSSMLLSPSTIGPTTTINNNHNNSSGVGGNISPQTSIPPGAFSNFASTTSFTPRYYIHPSVSWDQNKLQQLQKYTNIPKMLMNPSSHSTTSSATIATSSGFISPSSSSSLSAISPSSSSTFLNNPSSNPPQILPSTSISNSARSYSQLSEELKSMTWKDDLIDLGQSDGNILEYFDPLVIREKQETANKPFQTSVTANDSNSSSSSCTVSNQDDSKLEGEKKSSSQSEQQHLPSTSSSFRESSASSSSKMSRTNLPSTSSALSSSSTCHLGPPSLSLYPNLLDFQTESLAYDSLDLGDSCNDKDNASSLYDIYNPLEYLYTVSCSSPSSTSVTYEGALSQQLKTPGVPRPIGFSHYGDYSSIEPPKLPPRNLELFPSISSDDSPDSSLHHISRANDKAKRYGRLYENIESVKRVTTTSSEIQAFYEMIRELRFSNRHVDSTTNVGFIQSATLETKCLETALSLKVVVWDENVSAEAAAFTCDVSTTVDMVIDQSLIDLELAGSGRDYMLRIKGLNEYLSTEVPLSNYRYVQECIKMDQDIHLVLTSKSFMEKTSWKRTAKDDAASNNISIDDILPEKHSKTITYKDISIPLEVIDRESERLKEKLTLGTSNRSSKDSSNFQLNSATLMQPVKAVCVLLGEVQTIEIIETLNIFCKACNEWNSQIKALSPTTENRRRTKIVNDCSSRLSFVEIVPRNSFTGFDDKLKESVLSALERLLDAVRHLVEMYSKSFPVSFRMKEPPETLRVGWNSSCKPMSDMIESFSLGVGAVHRLKPEWLTTYTDYFLSAEVFHGTRWMGKINTGVVKVCRSDSNIFFHTILVDSWINFEHLPVCILPRESRVVFSLYGRKPNEDGVFETVELGWASMHCFNFKGMLAQGNYLLPFWPVGLIQKRFGPAPDSSFSSDGNSPLLTISFTDFNYDLPFPEIPSALLSPRDFSSLDPKTQGDLRDIFENFTFTKFPAETREVLWEKRHYLHDFPNALPQVLLSAQLWDWASLAELHAMLHCWRSLSPIDAMQLLLPCFPDAKVREQGIEWISNMSDEDLVNLLPQLVEALSFETFDFSPLARFLLKKSLSCLKISHSLFWLLVSQVGLGKWIKDFPTDAIVSKIRQPPDEVIYDPKRRRLELMFNSLMVISGEKWKESLISQYRLMECFYDVASLVKEEKSASSRQSVLVQELQKIQMQILCQGEQSLPLPLSPSYEVSSIDIKASSFFNSASVPLKISFVNGLPEQGNISTLYKVGDDLRQDMLTIQVIRVVEKWWLQSGLDLRVLTFSCVPTGLKQGFVEMVPNAETLCRIQAEHGLTGAFRNRPISEWLAKMNPSTLDYRRAIENFTLSCAAYCVVTYILGICDRHNDNIMLTKKGHLFHIDFGKFLGDAQMFGIMKRDRSPFVLTSDMVFVINDGEKDSSKFHRFVELCCQAFRVVRQNGSTLLNLFALMATAGIGGVDTNSVKYIQNALLPECSNSEAAARFASFIQESLQNWFTPVNFFLHTLAQMPFHETSDDPTKLSFVPTVYTMEMDGRIEKAEVVSFSKKYDPEKFYVYTIRIIRRGQTEASLLQRSYKEFLEFHTKLCINFPKAVGTLKSLPRGSGLSRSNVKQVTEKRKILLQSFVTSLFTLADEISHSSLVYTFFHPLLRDEEQHQEDEIERKNSSRVSLSRNPARIHGQIKLSLEYQRGALHVLILHAVDLACPNSQPPSPYVKTYLHPDPYRKTKRKTKVVKRSQYPTFMEMIEYRLPLEYIQTTTLAVSVWHYDPFQENNFLGGVMIPMSKVTLLRETTDTYNLGNIVSSS